MQIFPHTLLLLLSSKSNFFSKIINHKIYIDAYLFLNIFTTKLLANNTDSKQEPSCYDYYTKKQHFIKESFNYCYEPEFNWTIENLGYTLSTLFVHYIFLL